MNSGDEDAAALHVRSHHRGKRALSSDVQRCRRLVEQPKRTLGDKQTSKGHAAPLPGGEQPRREIDHMAEAQRRKRGELRGASGIAAEHRRGEGEILACGQGAFDPVCMAEIMRLFADRAFAIAALQRKAAGFKRQETGESPQQVVFPAPFGPVTMTPKPARASNESLSITRRPPRSMVRSDALSRIASPFRRLTRPASWLGGRHPFSLRGPQTIFPARIRLKTPDRQ